MYVADYQPNGYDPHLLTTRSVGPLGVEQDLLGPDYQRFRSEWESAHDAGRIFNGEVLALAAFSIVRTPDAERPGLALDFASTDYITQRSITSCYRGLPDAERALRARRVLGEQGPAGAYSCTFGASIAVVTADDQLVWLKRSANNAVNPGRYSCTIAEGMNRDDLLSSRPNPYLTAARGISEELGVTLTDRDREAVTLTALALNLDFWEWDAIGYLHLANVAAGRYTRSTISDYFTTARAKDKWETSSPAFTPFEPEAVAGFIAGHDVINYGIVSAVFALLSDGRFRRGDVLDAFDAAMS